MNSRRQRTVTKMIDFISSLQQDSGSHILPSDTDVDAGCNLQANSHAYSIGMNHKIDKKHFGHLIIFSSVVELGRKY